MLDRAGAKQGSIYGRLTDLEVYAAILNQDADLFAGIAEELARVFAAEKIEYVVGDAAEGYSVTHDICRIMIGAAVELVQQVHGHQIKNFDFNVVGAPDECPAELRDEAIWLNLDDDEFAHKVKAALGYTPKLAADVEAALRGAPFQGIRRFSEPKLAGEVDVEVSASMLEEFEARPRLKARLRHIIEGVPLDAFRIECLRPAGNRSGADWIGDQPLFYELYGEKLVAVGRYQKVIRYREHMLPLAEAMRKKLDVELCVASAS
nr:C676 [uncultured bacterium]ART36894.1 D46 [uncultured bacterium]